MDNTLKCGMEMNDEKIEELYTVLTELRQDAQMFRLMLFGLEIDMDELRLQCLFRVSDYLDQHIEAVCHICKYRESEPF